MSTAPLNDSKPVNISSKSVKLAALDRGEQEWYTLFRLLDHDNDGLIVLAEFQTAIMNSAKTLNLNESEAAELLKNVDLNDDKHVDFGEFSAMMARAKKLKMRGMVLFASRMVLAKGQTPQIRYLLQYNCLPPPLFMVLISLMQIISYFYYTLAAQDKFSPAGPVPFHSVFILNPTERNQIWRYITYQFIHIGYFHLIGNVLIQVLIGIPLELVHKFWRIGAIYTIGVISGALLMRALDEKTYLGGASGGVYTLISAHVANVILNWREMDFSWLRALILALFIILDVGMSVYQRFREDPQKVSMTAHIGGFVAGLFLGIVLLRNLRLKRCERIMWWICLVIYLIFVSVCIGLICSH